VDGNLRKLKYPFFVIATQNPVESRGTYPLPEAQMDRFALQFSLAYISAAE
jgi:MoxR-like ATPase